jgi:long-chain acyl-CoA synthetase
VGGAPRGTAAETTALLRATRETIAALIEARAPHGRHTAGEVRGHRALLHRILEAASRRPVRLAFHASPFATEWLDLIFAAIEVSDFTVGPMFFARAAELGDKTFFLLPSGREESRLSWSGAKQKILEIGRGLLAHRQGHGAGTVALLSRNSPESALFDLACLVTGTRNVPIPANSPPAQIEYILTHSGANALFLGDEDLAELARPALTGRETSVARHWLIPGRAEAAEVRPFEDFLAGGGELTDDAVREAALRVRANDLATTMYTSGTTGNPKGVPFTQMNIVSKRYARAMAWPDIGEGDVFLSYLPLFHTFGRWLELLGCVFWGAVYAFVDDSAIESLLYSFHRVRPTTFISVPLKWIQIAESIAPLADYRRPDDAELVRDLRAATGGRLRRGLSAAGYLPPVVFHRFHAAGIELHSGFGMTEATGGITMTPTGDYHDDSIGVALPGIELKIAEDGELLIRGPYVTPPAEDEPPREDGWLATGDIVRETRKGHLTIVDRKKEIFKNVQGETISPRRLEKLFSEFESIARVIVIGDGREYCTALIVPTPELLAENAAAADALSIDSPALREQFAPLVASVNRFLAPYERILDFAILARDLDPERGELTAKGTPKRKLVEERFEPVISPLYSRDQITFEVGGARVGIPNWFFRQTGVLARDVRVAGNALEIGRTGSRLPIERAESGGVRVGDYAYETESEEIPLGEIFGRPELWLGNEPVRLFAGRGIESWWRRGRRARAHVRLASRAQTHLDDLTADEAKKMCAQSQTLPIRSGAAPPLNLERLHGLASCLHHPDRGARHAAMQTLGGELRGQHTEAEPIVRDLLLTTMVDRDIRAEIVRTLLPWLDPADLLALLERHLSDPTCLDERECEILARQVLRTDQLEALIRWTTALVDEGAPSGRVPRGRGLERVLRFLVYQAANHPQNYRRIRTLLVTYRDETEDPAFRTALDRLGDTLVERFRAGLPHLAPAGIPWEEAIVFGDDVESAHRGRIVTALADTPLLAEVFVLYGDPLPPGGTALHPRSLRITYLGRSTGRAIYRLACNPQGLEKRIPLCECALKVNDGQDWETIQSELRTLIRARGVGPGRPVVKGLGGGYELHGLWTEEFIRGRTLGRLVEDLTQERLLGGESRGADAWQFLMANCASLVLDYWRRTGRNSIPSLSPSKVILPAHDWQVGGRIVSIAKRTRCERIAELLTMVGRGIVEPLEKKFPQLEAGGEWPLLFSAVLEIFGENEGLKLLEREMSEPRPEHLLHPASESAGREWEQEVIPAMHQYISSVQRHGFLPGRIRLAARRFRRWRQLNPDATLEAQAATLSEIGEAYGLDELEAERPEARLQFFRHTVFRGSDPEFVKAFDQLIARTHGETLTKNEWTREVGELREAFSLSDREEFFLARILYPHVDPRGRAVLLREEDSLGDAAPDVETEQQDATGETYRVRRPANPNEISELYRVFREADFRPFPTREETDHLIAIDADGRVIGGIVFRRMSATYVRLEWTVVSVHRQGRGLGSALLLEFMERSLARGVQVLSTGFFSPQFYRDFGFGVDPRYAGLVCALSEQKLTTVRRRMETKRLLAGAEGPPPRA